MANRMKLLTAGSKTQLETNSDFSPIDQSWKTPCQNGIRLQALKFSTCQLHHKIAKRSNLKQSTCCNVFFCFCLQVANHRVDIRAQDALTQVRQALQPPCQWGHWCTHMAAALLCMRAHDRNGTWKRPGWMQSHPLAWSCRERMTCTSLTWRYLQAFWSCGHSSPKFRSHPHQRLWSFCIQSTTSHTWWPASASPTGQGICTTSYTHSSQSQGSSSTCRLRQWTCRPCSTWRWRVCPPARPPQALTMEHTSGKRGL